MGEANSKRRETNAGDTKWKGGMEKEKWDGG